jgi:hypothetical protein
MERLIDVFDDKIHITKEEADEFVHQLEADTELLEACNVVDYSLFLVRYPAQTAPHNGLDRDVAVLSSRASPWRAGFTSSDGKWIYRAVILDFFWAKHKFQAQAMTGLISSFNFISGKGHMSITTNRTEYRERFLKMVNEMLETGNVEDV